MAREFAWLLTFTLVIASGCESTPPRRTAPVPSVRSFENIQRLAIVAFDAGGFTLAEQRSQPGRTLDEVLSWHPYGSALRPLAALVHRGVNSVRVHDQEIIVAESVRDVAAGRVIAEAMAQRLRASSSLDEVSVLTSEQNGAGHQTGGAIVRLTVTSWGLDRVRQDPDLFSSFADVTGLLAVSGTGVALWEHHEDVTGPDLIPFDAFRWDPTFTREQILNVLARAGERFAAEFLYARGANR